MHLYTVHQGVAFLMRGIVATNELFVWAQTYRGVVSVFVCINELFIERRALYRASKAKRRIPVVCDCMRVCAVQEQCEGVRLTYTDTRVTLCIHLRRRAPQATSLSLGVEGGISVRAWQRNEILA